MTTRRFDLTLIVEGPELLVVGVSAPLDGADLTSDLTRCLHPGALIAGGQTFRCPGLTGVALGTRNISVTLDLSDGSSVSSSVIWSILDNTEYVVQEILDTTK